MARFPGVRLLAAMASLVALAHTAHAQGGWSQWNVLLRDGTHVEANPLGAPDDTHFSVSVGGFEGLDVTILRSLVDYIAAQTTVGSRHEPIPGAKLPALPPARACEDVLVRRDGRRTIGHVTFTRVMYSSGTVRQRGVDIDLDDVAYIRFARKSLGDCSGTMAPATTARMALMSSRTREARVGIYHPLLAAGHEAHRVDPDTRSLRSLVRDDK